MKKSTKKTAGKLARVVGIFALLYVFTFTEAFDLFENLAQNLILKYNPDIISLAYIPRDIGPTLSVWMLGIFIFAAIYYIRIKRAAIGWRVLNMLLVVGMFAYTVHSFASYSYIPNDESLVIRNGFFKETTYPINELRVKETVDEYMARRSGKKTRMIIELYHNDVQVFRDLNHFSVLNDTLVQNLIVRGAGIEGTGFDPVR